MFLQGCTPADHRCTVLNICTSMASTTNEQWQTRSLLCSRTFGSWHPPTEQTASGPSAPTNIDSILCEEGWLLECWGVPKADCTRHYPRTGSAEAINRPSSVELIFCRMQHLACIAATHKQYSCSVMKDIVHVIRLHGYFQSSLYTHIHTYIYIHWAYFAVLRHLLLRG